MMKKLLIIIIVGIFVAGCGKKNVQLEEDLTPRFDKAMEYFDRECSNEVVSLYDNNEDTIFVIKDHHFYEGIQKYDMYFAGWDDNDSVVVVTKKHNDKNATSPNQTTYRSLWGDYNKIKTLAGNGGKFMLINRAVSMVDALLLAKKWNNSHDMNLSLNAYPDLRNKSGLGGVKLSLYWK